MVAARQTFPDRADGHPIPQLYTDITGGNTRGKWNLEKLSHRTKRVWAPTTIEKGRYDAGCTSTWLYNAGDIINSVFDAVGRARCSKRGGIVNFELHQYYSVSRISGRYDLCSTMWSNSDCGVFRKCGVWRRQSSIKQQKHGQRSANAFCTTNDESSSCQTDFSPTHNNLALARLRITTWVSE